MKSDIASPLFQIVLLKLYKEHKDIGNMPLFLILTIIFNCLFWLLNAFSSNDLRSWIPLLVSNMGGLTIIFVVNLMAEITYATFRYVISPKTNSDTFHLIGFVATIINVLMYSSPIQNIKLIIKEGKYQALPIYTLISGFFVTLTFFIQGIISFCSANTRDDRRNSIETMVSNGISFFLLACLAGVYAYFYFKPANPQNVSIVDINKGNMEEGINQKSVDFQSTD